MKLALTLLSALTAVALAATTASAAGGCPRTLDIGKSFPWATGNVDVIPGLAQFAVGLESRVGATADCDKLEAYSSVGLTATSFGRVIRPVELVLSAATKRDNRNALDVSAYAFGFELWRETFASSTTPLSFRKRLGYTVPAGQLDYDWSDSKLGFEYDVRFKASTSASFLITVGVRPTGVEARTLAAANVKGELVGTGEAPIVGPVRQGEV